MTDYTPTRKDLTARIAALEHDLAETRAQQAAIADVLGIISDGPADLEQVLPALLHRAVTLIGADGGTMSRDLRYATACAAR